MGNSLDISLLNKDYETTNKLSLKYIWEEEEEEKQEEEQKESLKNTSQPQPGTSSHRYPRGVFLIPGTELACPGS